MATARLPEGGGGQDRDSVPPVTESAAGQPPAWEMIENGRYQPRRIRGSYRGRELG